MHGVTGTLGHDMTFDASAGKCQVTDQIEHLVADILVAEAEWPVFRALRGEDDRVLRARAANEPHVAQFLLVGFVAEGARRSDVGAVGLGGQIDACLPAGRSEQGSRSVY